MFTRIYGAQTGNIALTASAFLDAFRSKGNMSPYVANIPMWVVMNPKAGLMGVVMVAGPCENGGGFRPTRSERYYRNTLIGVVFCVKDKGKDMQGCSIVERDVPRYQRIPPIHLLPTRHAIVARVGLSFFAPVTRSGWLYSRTGIN